MFDLQAAGEIRFLDLVPRLIRRYEALFDTVMDREMAAARKKTAATSLLTVSSWLGVAAAIVIGLVKASRCAGAGKIVAMLQASWGAFLLPLSDGRLDRRHGHVVFRTWAGSAGS